MSSLRIHRVFALGRLALALGLLAATGSRAVATTYTWNASSGTAWSTAGDWYPSGPPIGGSVVLFNSASYTNMPNTATTPQSVGAIWDTGTGSLTISGNAAGVLTLTGTTVSTNLGVGIELDSGAGSLTIAAPVALGGPQTWINNSNQKLTISGTVSGGTANALTTSGSGIIVLGNVGNSFSGNLTVSGGTLQATAAGVTSNSTTSALGNPRIASRTITVDDGGVLQFAAGNVLGQGGNTTPMLLVIGPSGLVTSTVSTNNLLGPVTLSGGTLSGGKGGTGGGYWTWQLTGGSVTVNTAPSLMTISLTSTDNGYNLSAATTTFNVAATGGPGYDLTVSAPLVDQAGNTTEPASLVKIGAGTMALSSTDYYSGTTTINGGTLLLANTAALLNSTFNTSGTGTLSFGALTSATFGGLSGSGALALTNSGATAGVALTVGNLTVVNSGSSATYGGSLSSTTFSGALSDAGQGGSLTKIGSNTLTMSGNNTYSGPTLVNNGTLVLSGSLGNSAVTVSSSAIFTGSNSVVGSLAVNGSATLASGNLTIAGSGGLAVNGGGALALTLGTSTAPLTVGNGSNGLMTLSSGTASGYGPGNYAALSYTLSSNGVQPINLGSGTLSINPGGVFVNVNFVTSPVAGATYPLINFGAQNVNGPFSLSPSASNVTSLMYGRDTYSLVDNTNSLQLQVTGPPVPGVAYFYGAVSSVWNDLTNSTSCNWSLDLTGTRDAGNTPGASTDVIFSATNLSGSALTTSLGGNTTINSLNVNAAPASTTISDTATLTINALQDSNTNSSGYTGNLAGNGISIAAGAGPVTLGLPVLLGGSQTWTNSSANTLTVAASGSIAGTAGSGIQTLTLSAAGSGGIALSGPISDSVTGGSLAVAVNSSGTGVTVLSASNTYTGGTGLMAGNLALGNSAALSSGAVTVSGGQLDLAGFSPVFSSLSGGGGTLTNLNSTAATLTVNSGSYAGTINDGLGTVALLKAGSNGMLVLAGMNNFSGGTTLSSGTLALGSNGALGNGQLNLDGGVLQATTALAFPLANSLLFTATSTFSGNNNVTFAGPLTNIGNNTLNLTGSGTLTLNAIYISDTPSQGRLFRVSSGGSNTNTSLVLNGTIADSSSGPSTPGGNITLSPQGAGDTITINGTNTFSGTSSLGGSDVGIIIINNNAAFGTSQVQLNQTALEAGSGAVTLANNVSLVSSPDSIQGSGGFPFNFAGPVTVSGANRTLNNNSNGLLTLSNNVYLSTVAGNFTLTMGGSGNITISGPIADNNGAGGTGGLLYNGSGLLTLSGADVYSNGTTVNSGTLTITPAGSVTDAGSVGLTVSGAATVANLQGTYNKTGNGYVYVEGGATLNVSGTLACYNGNDGIHVGQTGPGTMNVTSGAVTFGTPTSYMQIGMGSSGALNLSGGTVAIVSPASGLYVGNLANGVGVVNISGSGVLAVSSGNFDIGANGASGTINLNPGGVLQTSQALTGGSGTSTLNFNGGTLMAGANSANFISGLTAANVQDGGAIIDDGGYAVTINQDLLAAGSGTGGLTKVGSGTLVLSGTDTYGGGTFVMDGILEATNSTALLEGSSLIVGEGAAQVFGLVVPSVMRAGNEQAVPEPGTLALCGAALCAAAVYRSLRSRLRRDWLSR